MSIFNRDSWDRLDVAVFIIVVIGTIINIFMLSRLFDWVFDKIEQVLALFWLTWGF